MSNKINNFKKAITNYIEIDKEIENAEKKNEMYITRLKEKIKELEAPVKNLKTKKTEILEYITQTMRENRIEGKSLKIKHRDTNYTIKCEKTEKKDTLTQKYLKDSLINYHNHFNKNRLSKNECEKNALEQFQYLLDNRTTKESLVLVYNKD